MFDPVLAERVREELLGVEGITEKRMFGGLAFLVDGHLAVAASGQGGLLVRVDPAGTAALRRRKGVGPMVMRGKELDGWVRVDAEAVRTRRQLVPWIERGVGYARSL